MSASRVFYTYRHIPSSITIKYKYRISPTTRPGHARYSYICYTVCTPCVLYDHLTIVIRHVRCTDYGVRTSTVYSSYENDTTPQGRGDHLPAVSSRSTHCCVLDSEDRNDAPHAPPIHHTPHHVHRSPDRNYSAAHLSIKPSPKSLGRASYHRNKRTPRVVGTLAAHRAHARARGTA